MTKPIPAIRRNDIPEQIMQVLVRALQPDPNNRYYSALEFAYAMQQAQYDAYGHATPVSVEDADRFNKNLQRAQAAAQIPNRPAPGPAQHHSRKAWIITGSVVAVLAVLALLFTTLVLPNLDRNEANNATVVNPQHQSSPSSSDEPSSNTEIVPSPIEMSGRISGDSAQFTWTNPDPQPGDKYAYSTINGSSDNSVAMSTDDTSVTIPAEPGAQTCIQVSIIRADHTMSQQPATYCAVRG